MKLLVTVEVIPLTLFNNLLHVGLIAHKAIHTVEYALPCGGISPTRDREVTATAHRVFKEAADLEAEVLVQLNVQSGASIEKSNWRLTVPFYAITSTAQAMSTSALTWAPVATLGRLSTGHQELVRTAVSALQGASNGFRMACAFLPDQFTLTQLQQAYEGITGIQGSAGTFRKKLEGLDWLEAVPEQFQTGKQRPAQLYRVNPTPP